MVPIIISDSTNSELGFSERVYYGLHGIGLIEFMLRLKFGARVRSSGDGIHIQTSQAFQDTKDDLEKYLDVIDECVSLQVPDRRHQLVRRFAPNLLRPQSLAFYQGKLSDQQKLFKEWNDLLHFPPQPEENSVYQLEEHGVISYFFIQGDGNVAVHRKVRLAL